jgi:hypothetical protein
MRVWLRGATEEGVEAAVLEKTGLRTPWLKYTLHEFVEQFEDKAGIVTWEMVPEAERTIMEKLECIKAAFAYMAERKFDVVRSFSFSFQIADPDDEVDDDAIADAVYLETGIGTEWFPHRPGDTPRPATTKELPTLPTLSTAPAEEELPTLPAAPAEEELPALPTLPTLPTTYPFICPKCKKVLKNKHAKIDRKRRGKCIVTPAWT